MPSPVLMSQKAERFCGQELFGASQMERPHLFFGFYLIMLWLERPNTSFITSETLIPQQTRDGQHCLVERQIMEAHVARASRACPE